MAQNETWLKHDLLDAVKVQYLDGNLFSMDNAGNLIGVTLTRDGEDYSGGGSVSANVIRSDGGTVAVIGALSGKTATVVLPQAAYAVPGVVSIIVKLTASGQVTTIAALVANVYRSSTDTAIDPGTIIPSIQTLISQINTAVASIPADYSALWTKLAPAFDPNASYVAGQYVTNNSGLWRFNTSHSGSWSSSDVTAVNLGGEITELKSAIGDFNNTNFISENVCSNTGTAAGYWGSVKNKPSQFTDDLYLKITSAIGTTRTTDYIRVWIYYSDSTNDNGYIKSIGKWTKIETNKTKQVTGVDLYCYRASSAVSESVTTVYNVIACEGKPLAMKEEEDVASLEAGTAEVDEKTKVLPSLESRMLDIDSFYSLNVQDFDIGSITTSSYPWSYDIYATRVRMKSGKTIDLKAGDVIQVNKSGFRLYTGYYTDDSQHGSSNFTTVGYVCPVDGHYTVVISKTTEENVTDVSEYVYAISIIHMEYYSTLPISKRFFKQNTDKNFKNLFELGTINSGTTPPTYSSSTTRIRTLKGTLIPLHVGDRISFTDYTGIEFILGWQKSDGTWGKELYWLTNDYIIQEDGQYWILIEYRNSATITNIDTLTSKLRIYRLYNFEEDIISKIQKNKRRNWFVKSVNHRGYNRLYPENTLIAFKASALLGWDAVETDVRFTSDGVAVLLHDESINRTARNADGTTISSTVNIADITYEQALEYDFGLYKGDQFAGTKIPTLEQYLKLCRELSIEAYIETKAGDIGSLVDIVKENGMLRHTTWISFARTHLEAILTKDPYARVGLLPAAGITSGVLEELNSLKNPTNYVFADMLTTYITQQDVETLAKNNIGLGAYMPNSPSEVASLPAYVMEITSDYEIAGEDLYDLNI